MASLNMELVIDVHKQLSWTARSWLQYNMVIGKCIFYFMTCCNFRRNVFQWLHILARIWYCSGFLNSYFSHSIGMSYYITVVVIWVSLMTKKVEHLFLCLYMLFVSPSAKVSDQIICLFCFFNIAFWYIFIYSVYKSFIRYLVLNIFSQSVNWLFIFWPVSLKKHLRF